MADGYCQVLRNRHPPRSPYVRAFRPRVLPEGERGRFLRAEPYTPHPGGQGIVPAGMTTGEPGAWLKRDPKARVMPSHFIAVKRGLDRVESVRPATKAAVERRKASAPEADGSCERIIRGARRAGIPDGDIRECRVAGWIRAFRRSASLLWGRPVRAHRWQDSGAQAPRERVIASASEAIQGGLRKLRGRTGLLRRYRSSQ